MRTTFLMLLLGLMTAPLPAAVRGDEALYVGGTISHLIPDKTEGKFDTSGETAAVFRSKKGEVTIPYRQILTLEYGQKAGRRVGAAIVVSPVLLFSKKRKHYLTVGFNDDHGKQQGAVFELSKGSVRSVLTILETRSGKSIEYESEEARKHAGK